MEQLTVDVANFLWQELQQVLPKGFRRSCNFGHLLPNCMRMIALLHLLVKFASALASAEVRERASILCTCCGAEMKIERTSIPSDLAGGPSIPPAARVAI